MLTLGSRFKARLQVRQNVFSSKFLWNFVISSCFFLVFQEARIHSAGLQPSISMYDLHRFTLFASSGSHPHTSLQNPLPRPWPSFSTASTSFPSSFHLPILAIRNFLPEESPSEAAAIIGRGLHRGAGRQQPLDHAVVAVSCCPVQRRVASERPQGWLKLKVQ